MPEKPRIFLSPPHLGNDEIDYIKAAFAENYITTAGRNLNQFEQELCHLTGSSHAVALNSGTAAIHLALKILGVGPGDEVICPTFSFVASANPILYQGATPVFVDSELETWNMCPQLVEKAITERLSQGKKIKALVVVHLYGMPAKLNELLALSRRYQIPMVEDAAEALGSAYHGKPVGTFGEIGIFSFNGNKIITTSGGGALLTDNPDYAQKALFLATQAKDPAPHYQHSQMGYNYRMSNISASIGLSQLKVLPERVAQRRAVFAFYRQALAGLPGVSFLPEPDGYFSNRWLTCLLLSEGQAPTSEKIRLALAAENIESRPLWKPLHLQPLFAACPYYGREIATNLFNQGLCLPSGSALTPTDLHRIVAVIENQF